MKKLNHVIDDQVVKNTKFNKIKTKVNKLDKKMLDTTTLTHINQYSGDKQNFQKKTGDADKKIRDISVLGTNTTVLSTKFKEVDNKIPDASGLVKKTDYDAKTTEIEGKYFTTSDYNNFTSDILDAKIKQKELVNISNISNLV